MHASQTGFVLELVAHEADDALGVLRNVFVVGRMRYPEELPHRLAKRHELAGTQEVVFVALACRIMRKEFAECDRGAGRLSLRHALHERSRLDYKRVVRLIDRYGLHSI